MILSAVILGYQNSKPVAMATAITVLCCIVDIAIAQKHEVDEYAHSKVYYSTPLYKSTLKYRTWWKGTRYFPNFGG